MPRPSLPPLEVCTQALRLRSLPILSEGLVAYLRSCESFKDARDIMVGLALFHDCARRSHPSRMIFLTRQQDPLDRPPAAQLTWLGRITSAKRRRGEGQRKVTSGRLE